MPQIKLEDLGDVEVKPGDTISFKVDKVENGLVELSYEQPEVEENDEETPMEKLPLDKMRQKMVKKVGETDSEGM